MKHLLLTLAFGLFLGFAKAQTYPAPHDLNSGPFIFNEIQPGGAFPIGMDIYSPAFPLDTTGWFTTEPNAPNVEAAFNWPCASASQRSRFKYLATNGLSFSNTGQPQWDNCSTGTTANNLRCGIALINLNTVGLSGGTLSWTCGLVAQGDGNGGSAGTTNPRVYALTAQARIGSSGAWIDIPGGEFSSLNLANGDTTRFTYTLPTAYLNQNSLQIRWFYFQKMKNLRGTRPEIRLDNILITNIASGLNSLELEGIRVFPNPSKGFAGVESTQEGLKVSIFNALGQMISNQDLLKGYNHLPIKTPGIYKLKFISNNGQDLKTATVIIE